MRIELQIKASFLLGIFLLMSFHQVIPHAHHEHVGEKNEIAHHPHQDGEEHQHEKQEKEQQGFLSYLLALHSHSSGTNEIPVLREHTENFAFEKIENEKLKLDKQFAVFDFFADQDFSKSKIYQPPRKYFNPYLSFLSLRGPPAIA